MLLAGHRLDEGPILDLGCKTCKSHDFSWYHDFIVSANPEPKWLIDSGYFLGRLQRIERRRHVDAVVLYQPQARLQLLIRIIVADTRSMAFCQSKGKFMGYKSFNTYGREIAVAFVHRIGFRTEIRRDE